VNGDVYSLTQRLDAAQNTANLTASDLNARLLGSEQQFNSAMNNLQRELQNEREKCREALNQKKKLQKRMKQVDLFSPNNSFIAGNIESDGDAHDNNRISMHSSPYSSSQDTSPFCEQYEKPEIGSERVDDSIKEESMSNAGELSFSNENYSKAGLANMSVALIRAQIGLDLTNTFDECNSSIGISAFEKQQIDMATPSNQIIDYYGDALLHQAQQEQIPMLKLTTLRR